MSSVNELSQEQEEFLSPFLPQNVAPEDYAPGHQTRPLVTLTWAQSVDSMISRGPGLRTTLSGPETKSMTHYLRLHHDAILIGAGTAIADNPGLNCRYPGATFAQQPRPVVLDANRRWMRSEESRVIQLATDGRGKEAWVFVNPCALSSNSVCTHRCCHDLPLEIPRHLSEPHAGRFVWAEVLDQLHQRGINSVMVEGGASVINSLLAQPHLVDSVIVTVAPTWLGPSGVQVAPPELAGLSDAAWKQFGMDVVLCGHLQQNMKNTSSSSKLRAAS